jgi:Cu(I)/Ag(I) efflux system membrane fusion protein
MNARISDLMAIAWTLAAVLAAGCTAVPEEAPPGAVAGAHGGHHHTGHEPAHEAAPDGTGDTGGEVAHYTCSMHPAVKNAGPGSCPICAMALVPVFRREIAGGEILLDEGRRQRIGVTTARAELRPLAVQVRAVGTVTYDESRLTDVTLEVGGWIDELYADRLGRRVNEGEPLFALYSPELFEAQQKYVEALESLDNARKLRSPLAADLLIETRRRRLRLSDLGPDQLERLEERGLPAERVLVLAPASGHVIEKNVVTGAAVSAGARLLRIAGLERVWVEAEIYESELALLAVGDPATVTLRYLPGRELHGRIAFVYPWLDDATRTGRVRIELANPDLALKPDMYAEVVFESALGERLAVPDEAILYAGDRRYVFLDLGRGRLRPQAVTLGRWAGDWVEILDGLEPGDRVVTSGNFLIAAEARLKLALDHWAPEASGAEAAAPVHPAEDPEDHGDPGDHAAHDDHGDHGGQPEPRR